MSTISPLRHARDVAHAAGVIAFQRALVAPSPAWESEARVGVGVADLASGRAREVWVVLPPTVSRSLDQPRPGRPLFGEFFRRSFGALLRRAGPQEARFEGVERIAARDVHGGEWEAVPQASRRDSSRPDESYPLRLLTLLGAPPEAVVAVEEHPGGGEDTTLVARIDLRVLEPELSPLEARALQRGAEPIRTLRATVDATGFPTLIALLDRATKRSTQDTWTLLALTPCDEPFEAVDLFARWEAG